MSPARSLPPLRTRVERRSAVLTVYLAGRRGLIFLVTLAAVIGYVLLRGPYTLLLGVPLLAVAAWLSYLSWPQLARGPRAVRLVVLVALVAILLARAVPR